MEPTEAQIKEFWEKIGLPYSGYGNAEREKAKSLPPIDLNNLFKYAVPLLRNLSEDNTLQDIEFHWQGINISNLVECNLVFDEAQFDGTDKDPALALFWAIWEVLKEA